MYYIFSFISQISSRILIDLELTIHICIVSKLVVANKLVVENVKVVIFKFQTVSNRKIYQLVNRLLE